MQIEIEYGTQVRVASGVTREKIETPEGSTAAELLAHLLTAHDGALAPWITADGQPRPGLLVFINDQSPASLQNALLRHGDHVALMTLVSGG